MELSCLNCHHSSQGCRLRRPRLPISDLVRTIGQWLRPRTTGPRQRPVVVDWLEQNPLHDGVELIAVSTAVDPTGPNYPPSEWFEREHWPTPVLLDSQDDALSQAFGLTAFPYWVAIDADGEVVARVAGSLSEADLSALVASLS